VSDHGRSMAWSWGDEAVTLTEPLCWRALESFPVIWRYQLVECSTTLATLLGLTCRQQAKGDR